IIKSMQGINAVAHLGAIVGDPACEIDKDISFDINTMATRMIAEAAKGFGVLHFVFASTCSVYGASDVLITEKSMLNPVSMYAKTKIASEKVLLFLSDTNFKPIIMRFATIYGMSYRPRFDLVVNTLAAKAYFEKKINIFGGDQWRPFLHVDDVSEAIVKCLKSTQNNIDGQVLNIGASDQNYQLKDIGKIVKEVIPNVEVITLDKDVDKRNYRVSFDNIRNILDFTNTKTIKDGINEIVNALNNGVLHEDYTSNRFNNYRFLSNENYLNRYRLTKLSKDMLEEESYEIL
ncbi:MAG: NAD-dependent epimerase/dehydratase family protein, partial [bacterium]